MDSFWFVVLVGVVAFVGGYVVGPWINKMVAKLR